ncbi:MAG: dihydroorotate dehydrogenase-like protein [Pirellulales bacterium]|nr:dihydroorotate dehydrogenase-like protein [Pirellulales bacterium]
MSVDLSTRYLGISLANPLVASSGPNTSEADRLKQLQDAGVAAAVLPSLFEEQIAHQEEQLERLYGNQADSFAESLTYFPEVGPFGTGPDDYLRLVESAKKAVAIPIIGSLNGSSTGGWTKYAKAIQDAGADALELNAYLVATDPDQSASDIENQYIDLVKIVRETVTIPLAVKIGARFSSIPNFARKLIAAGADGLVLFNRFRAPDIDLDTLQVRPEVVLSSPHELRLPLRWIAIIRDHLSASLAASTGIHTASDVLKGLLVGANVVMMTSVLIKQGSGCIQEILREMTEWMEQNEYRSVEQLRGSLSLGNCPDPSAFERANYMKALVEYAMKH